MLAQRIGRAERAVGAHPGVVAAAGIAQHRAGLQQAGLDQHAERDARLRALARLGRHVVDQQRLDRRDPLAGGRGVGLVAFQSDEVPAEPLRRELRLDVPGVDPSRARLSDTASLRSVAKIWIGGRIALSSRNSTSAMASE